MLQVLCLCVHTGARKPSAEGAVAVATEGQSSPGTGEPGTRDSHLHAPATNVLCPFRVESLQVVNEWGGGVGEAKRRREMLERPRREGPGSGQPTGWASSYCVTRGRCPLLSGPRFSHLVPAPGGPRGRRGECVKAAGARREVPGQL